jgi:hypothetical protein
MSIQIISTVLVAASTYDLTDLATAKDELSIKTAETSNDAFISRAITQVSAAVANYCNRTFQLETVQDVCIYDRDAYPYQVPGGGNPLQLSRYPMTSAYVMLATSGAVASGAVLNFAATAGVFVGQPVAGTNIPIGAVVSAVGASSVTISVAVAGTVAAGAAITFGTLVVVANSASSLAGLVQDTDYRVDGRRGQLVRCNAYTGYPLTWNSVPTTVIYQGGYATIPADITDVVLRAVTQRLASRGRDPFLKHQTQPGIGEQSYWIGGTPGSSGAFTRELADQLDNYRVPVTA